MASILSQYKVHFRPHEPFVFSQRLLLSSVSQLFLVYSAKVVKRTLQFSAHCLLGAWRSINYQLLLLGASLNMYLQSLMRSYLHTIARHKHPQKRCHCGLKSSKGFENTPCLRTYCIRKGAQSLHIFVKNTIPIQKQVNSSTRLNISYNKQLLFKRD